jgi:ribosomal protein S18 acetylase RimI-like enzyme
MIRPTDPTDTLALLDVARGTGVFRPAELVALREVLDDYHAREHASGHRAVTCQRDGRPVGFAYYAPSAMSERGWYLWWIAVESAGQGQGIGAELLAFAEDDVRAAGGRLMIIETSGQPRYEPTRRFYLGHGYEVAAVIKDFYTDGDDQVIFVRRFQPFAAQLLGADALA